MFGKMGMVIGTAALVAVLGLSAVGTAVAQGPAPAPTSAPGTPWGQAWGRVCQGAGIVSQAVSQLLGMTPEQVYAERTAGKTLAQIATEKGVTDQQPLCPRQHARADGRWHGNRDARPYGRRDARGRAWALGYTQRNASAVIPLGLRFDLRRERAGVAPLSPLTRPFTMCIVLS